MDYALTFSNNQKYEITKYRKLSKQTKRFYLSECASIQMSTEKQRACVLFERRINLEKNIDKIRLKKEPAYIVTNIYISSRADHYRLNFLEWHV